MNFRMKFQIVSGQQRKLQSESTLNVLFKNVTCKTRRPPACTVLEITEFECSEFCFLHIKLLITVSIVFATFERNVLESSTEPSAAVVIEHNA